MVKWEWMETLYRDEWMLVLDKPAGLPVLPDGWEADAPYVVRLVEQDVGKVWVVHRLDKVTSGVLVFALTAEAHRRLSMLFEKHEAEKVYHALVNGSPPWDQKTAKHPLRANVGHKHRTQVNDRMGKASETHFHVLERFAAQGLVEAKPVTGRTHQVRAHLYALGHPLLGDELYGGPETQLISRPALHAYSLAFNHPESGQLMDFKAPYPADFEAALRSLRGQRPQPT
jgi:RluA family pseudouridine synthase